MKTRILLLLLLCFGMGAARAQYQQINDLSYAPDGANEYARERCKLDVYYPTDVSDAPVVVWFHGGGLEGGSKYIPTELTNSGLVVVAVNYRLMPQAAIAECVDDAAAAVAWAFRNAQLYHGSPSKIFVSGHSAGGYLATMIGFERKWLAKYGIEADSIAGLCPITGQCITHFNVRKQQGLGPLQPTIDEFAPLYHIRQDCPPVIIISADRELELYGRYEEQAYLYRMLKLMGHPDVTLYELQGYEHGNVIYPAFHILKNHIKRLVP